MLSNELQNKMNTEIERRLNSREWDLDIASRVISMRNKKIKRNIFVALSSSGMLAAAAVIVVAFFLNTSPVTTNDLELFLSRQADGTHKEVFSDSYSNNLMNVNFIEGNNDQVDNLITNALYSR